MPPRPRLPVGRARHDLRQAGPDWVDRTRQAARRQGRRDGARRAVGALISTSRQPLDDIRVRQAIAHAIDRKAIGAVQGATRRARRPRSCRPAISAPTKAPLLPYDLAKAKALLTEAGYPERRHDQGDPTTLPRMLTLIEAVQAQLREAGIKLEIEPVEHATFHAQIRKDLSQIVHLPGGALPGRRRLSDAVLPLARDRRHADRDDELPPLQRRRRTRSRRRARADQQAEALWKTAQEKIVETVCAVPCPRSSSSGLEGHARSRLRAARARSILAARDREDALHQVRSADGSARRCTPAAPAILFLERGRYMFGLSRPPARTLRLRHAPCAVLTLVFLIVRVLPGDPAQVILGDRQRGGDRGAAHAARPRSAALACNTASSWPARCGDWGVSMVTGRPVIAGDPRVLPWTIELTSSR